MSAEPAGERPMRFERRMSDAEAAMWAVEKDPGLRSSFLNVTLLDRPPDFERFRERMERATVLIPRLRQRVVSSPLNVAPPQWATDPVFDLDFHVRRLGVPAPGGDRQLLDLAALAYEDAFDRARPLWHYYVADGLDDGRAALLAKMHHTITDGVGGVRLSAMFIDLEREAVEPEQPAAHAASGEPGADGTVAAMAEAIAHNLRRQVGMGRRAALEVARVAANPLRVVRGADDFARLARTLTRQLASEPARSPLWRGKRGLKRRFEVLSVDLDQAKRVGKALGGTVNDVYVAGVAGGVGVYHRAKGAEVDELRMAMPVSTRSDRSVGGNAFSPTRVLVPVGLKDPVERFRLTRERLAVTKQEGSLPLLEGLASVARTLPTAVLVRLARQQVSTIDFTTSNLRGAPWDLYIAGARILSNHPMGPTAGTAFNATVLSYLNSLDIGLNIDLAAIDEPELLRDSIAESFAELLACA